MTPFSPADAFGCPPWIIRADLLNDDTVRESRAEPAEIPIPAPRPRGSVQQYTESVICCFITMPVSGSVTLLLEDVCTRCTVTSMYRRHQRWNSWLNEHFCVSADERCEILSFSTFRHPTSYQPHFLHHCAGAPIRVRRSCLKLASCSSLG